MEKSSKYAPQARYDAANCTQVKLKLNVKTDADIIAYLSEKGNKQGYIKALIREDMRREIK
jgi:hypothetical protein